MGAAHSSSGSEPGQPARVERPRWMRVMPIAVASLVLLLGLAASGLIHQQLLAAEARAINRHIEQISRLLAEDLATNFATLVDSQQRLAARLGAFDRDEASLWVFDSARYLSDFPFLHSLALTDTELQVSDIAGQALPGMVIDAELPIGPLVRQWFDNSPGTDSLLVKSPVSLNDGRHLLHSLNRIGSDGQPQRVLVATYVIPDALDALISSLFRDILTIQVSAQGQALYPHPRASLEAAALPAPTTVFEVDLDGDGSGFQFEVGLTPESLQQMQSRLPIAVLYGGAAASLLLAVISLLGLQAGQQARQMARVNRALNRAMSEQEQARQALAHLATHDPLTDLPNRQGAKERLGQLLAETRRSGEVFAVMFLDLDQFKDINDSLGHQIGDRLLQAIAPRLAGLLRPEDFLGRHGGDEFLLAARRGRREAIESLAADLLAGMERGFTVGDNRFFISASIGIAFYPDSGENVDELIQNADTALFKAKHAGRNQYAVFTREMFGHARHRLHLSRDMRQGLERGDFHVAYQPIVSATDYRLCGVEALCRWKHEKGYMVPPQEFVRIAEDTGLIGRLGQFVMEQALADLAGWQTIGAQTPWLSVNVSGVQVRESGFAESLSVLLHRHRIDPERLHLEITEEILIENLARNRALLADLDAIGMRIVVDDFGVGYSSLAYLKNFPVSIVKIDRSFVSDLARDAEDQAITRAICSLSADLGMETIAEGVESAEQLALLRHYGCRYVQGFLFSRPVSAEEITAWLRQGVPWSTPAA
ncbi:MAG: putative bifunctional diguanylate cyclase/phosphodiesterase [Wenzhouxiangella sp.]